MSCKSVLYTANTGAQTVASGGTIALGSIIRRFGCGADLNGTGINLSAPGYYKVSVSATMLPAEAGAVTVSLLKDGVAVPGGVAAETVAAAGDFANLSFASVVRIPCCGNPAALTLVLTGTASNVTNVAVVVEKL